MSETQQGETWGEAMSSSWDVALGAVLEPAEYLSEPVPIGQAGSYWPPTRDLEDDAQALAAWERELDRAISMLDALLTTAGRARSDRSRAMRIAAIDRALADPRAGYLRRLRQERSEIMRRRHLAGTPTAVLAAEARVSRTRARQLMANNARYVSEDRRIALASLARESRERREADRAARERVTADRAAARAAERIAQGRVLAARITSGETRESLQAEFGYSRQKLAALLAEAARADAVPAQHVAA